MVHFSKKGNYAFLLYTQYLCVCVCVYLSMPKKNALNSMGALKICFKFEAKKQERKG